MGYPLDGMRCLGFALCFGGTGCDRAGETMTECPGAVAARARCKPILEELPGWDSPTASTTEFASLPTRARAYVDRLQELIGCPFDLISTGRYRHETIKARAVIEV